MIHDSIRPSTIYDMMLSLKILVMSIELGYACMRKRVRDESRRLVEEERLIILIHQIGDKSRNKA